MKYKWKQTIAVVLSVACVAVFAAGCDNEGDTYTEDNIIVTLNYNDGASRPLMVYAEEGGSIAQPDEPLREGYSFDRWTTAADGGDVVTFPYTPSENTTLYVQWKAATYDVTFDFNFAGSDPYVVEAEYNSTVTADDVVIPANSGHSFYRWETLPDGGEEVTFPYTVRRDITFYATWLTSGTQVFSVTFDGNFDGAEENAPRQVVDGAAITARVEQSYRPTRTGYTFRGWATTATATVEDIISFPYRPTGSCTLYAVWERQSSRVVYYYNYVDAPASIYTEETVDFGDVVNAPTEPSRSGFTFMGWYTAYAEGNLIEFPYTTRGAVAALYAHWQADVVTTNKFDAEFTAISPNFIAYGSSGEAHGVQIIQSDNADSWGASSESYPLLDSAHTTHANHYVSYMTRAGASLTFEIYSQRAQTVTLYASLINEFIAAGYSISPEGTYGFSFNVNGTPITYSSINIPYQGRFTEYNIGSIQLQEGRNTIMLTVNNNYVNGTMTGVGPSVDYIRLDGGTGLTWHPEYDNLYRRPY